MEDIILQYTYPRLDAEVSKHRNHLLKAPFCVHPATGMSILIRLSLFLMGSIRLGRICVPVKPSEVARFDPEDVPTVGQLLRELDEQTMDGGDERAGTYHSIATGHYLTIIINQTGNVRPYDRMSKCWMHTFGVSCRRLVRPCLVCVLPSSFLNFTRLILSIGGKNKLDW